MSNNIDLHVQWIPREFNFEADAISKFKDCDDWQLSHEFFLVLESKWGPHTLDCFASFYNAKTTRFYSRFWNPGTSGVDAFYQSWEGENYFVVPPVSIIPKVMNFILKCEQCLCDCCRSGMTLRNFLAIVVVTSLQVY